MGRVVKFLREGDGCGIGVAAVVAAQHLHIRSGDAPDVSRLTSHVTRHSSAPCAVAAEVAMWPSAIVDVMHSGASFQHFPMFPHYSRFMSPSDTSLGIELQYNLQRQRQRRQRQLPSAANLPPASSGCVVVGECSNCEAAEASGCSVFASIWWWRWQQQQWQQ